MRTTSRRGLALALALSAAIPALGSGSAGATRAVTYDVSLGDSYAAGYQYAGEPANLPLHGYANQLVTLLDASHHRMTLENCGCGGATTTSMLDTDGCPDPTIDGPTYPLETQLGAALAFITAHAGHIGLVTISIGGNDFDGCVASSTPSPCVAAAMPQMEANITSIASQLRAAAGAHVPIIAITYPDVVLGAWLTGTEGRTLAEQSVEAFSLLINPDMKSAYAASDVSFVDVTSATGAYIALTRREHLAPYGSIPVAVARVCSLTWYCAKGSIHPRTVGYTLIAKLIEKRYLHLVR